MKSHRPLQFITLTSALIFTLGLTGCGRESVPRTEAQLKTGVITASTLKGYKLDSRDGDIGKVKELYFDDQHWTVRYLVADTGNWLTGRQVLISPYLLGDVNREKQEIGVDLTKKQIEESPSIESDKPVSRQFENSYNGYYGMPMYYGGAYTWGYSSRLERDRSKWRQPQQGEKTWDAALRSTHDVEGHTIQATDGDIGHVEDFIIDPETWAIRYLIVDTQNWWPGKSVLISPQWIDRVSWGESKVFVNISREQIKGAPEYTKGSVLNRDYETKLYKDYNRPGYWVDEPATPTPTR